MPTKKKTKKKTPTKPDFVAPVEQGNFLVTLSTEELYGLIQTLGFSTEIFEKMAENMMAEGNDKAVQVYSARSELSLILYKRLSAVAGIGEPTSRNLH